MPHIATRRKPSKPTAKAAARDSRFTVALEATVAGRVEDYAETVDISMSKAIAALVRLGLENQEARKRDFFKKLKENLNDDSPENQERLVDEFKALILGH